MSGARADVDVRAPWVGRGRSVNRGRRGYTLIEILVVAVLLGLIAGLGVPTLVRRVMAEGPQGAMAGIQSFAAQVARSAQGPGAILHIANEGMRLDDETGRTVLRYTWPRSVEVQWRDETGRAASTWSWDGRGRCLDAVVEVRQQGRTLRQRLLGLTGEWCEERQ